MKSLIFLSACAATLGLATSVAQAQATPVATGLSSPQKVTSSYRGSVFVSESGTGVNDGEVTRIDSSGVAETLVTGLPSGVDKTGGRSGPTGLAARGCCSLDALIGEGDVVRFDVAPREVPNPVPSVSPIFSSLLRFHFDRSLDDSSGGFQLTPADHSTLADGFSVRVKNAAGESLWVYLVDDFKDFRPDPVAGSRASNPYGIDPGGLLEGVLLTDAGQNSVVHADQFGPPRTLLRFPPIVNPAGTVPPVSDPVPTSIRHVGGSQYLVSLLTGVPFRPGAASIRLVDVHKRTQSTLITGLTSVTDVLRIGGSYYVLELSTNLSAGAPGRLLRYDGPSATPVVVAAPIIGGSGMTYVAKERAIYIAENFTGRVVKVAIPGGGK